MPKKTTQTYLGFDLGASSGRAVAGIVHGDKLVLREVHRFTNEHLELDGSLYWDFLGLWQQVCQSLRRCSQQGYKHLAGIGVDTWGVDFGILGRDGRFVRNALCHRDPCTVGTDVLIHARIPARQLYDITGLTFLRVSSLPQLVAMQQGPGVERLRIADTLLMMPDVFNFFLSGRACTEHTIAGSSLLYDINKRNWSSKIIKTFRLPRSMFPEIVEPATKIGTLKSALAGSSGLNRAPLIAVAGHDTASAFAAAPYADAETIIISCGTWSVLGQNRDEPLLTDAAFESGFINEPGLGSVLFVRNLMGLYLFENLKRELDRSGRKTSYTQMVTLARKAKPFARRLDTNAPVFFAAKEPLQLVQDYLRRTGQKTAAPDVVMRLLLEGLVFSYRAAIEKLCALKGGTYRRICMVGGGSRNALLCQMTADATGLPVVAGPAEAAVIGNFVAQMRATGALTTAAGARHLLESSFSLRTYKPRETASWDKAYPRYRVIAQK